VCRHGVFLLDGTVAAEGSQRDALRAYLEWVDTGRETRRSEAFRPKDSDRLRLVDVTLLAADGGATNVFRPGDDVTVRLRFRAEGEIARPFVSVGITDGRPTPLISCSMLVDGEVPDAISGEVEVSCAMRGVPLLPRVYEIWVSVRSEHGLGDIFDWQPIGAVRFARDESLRAMGPAADVHTSTDAPVFVEHRWTVER
jgi:Wzt-like putative exopolysaccharide export protein